MKQPIWVQELESLHDEAFIDGAYRAVLGRTPDIEGAGHYLGLLRSGKLRRFDILVRLRLSPEGRKYGAPMRGFYARVPLSLLRQIPCIGPLLSLPCTVHELRAEVEHLRRQLREGSGATCDATDQDMPQRVAMWEERSFRIVNSLEQAMAIFSLLDGKIASTNQELQRCRQELATLRAATCGNTLEQHSGKNTPCR